MSLSLYGNMIYQYVSAASVCSAWPQAEVASLAAPRPTDENRPANLPEAALATQVAAPLMPCQGAHSTEGVYIVPGPMCTR